MNIIFNKEISWSWHENSKGVLIGSLAKNEASLVEEQQPTSPISSHSILTSSFLSESETPLRKFRSLAKIYKTLQVLLIADPTTFKEALEKEECHNSMKDKITTIQKNKPWKLVDLPIDKNVIGVKQILKIKFQVGGKIEKWKAWLVVKCYLEK